MTDADAGIAHELTRVSGAHAGDCCFIAQRYEEADGCFRPGRGESYVCTVTPERTRLEIGGPGWLTGIWRAPDRTIYASDIDGRVYVLPRGEGSRWDIVQLRGALTGVWGLDESHVWVWGTHGPEQVLYRYDGRGWTPVPSPGEIVALHGSDPTLVLAVGHRGLIARWDGRAWTKMESPVHETINGVAVASENEAYAVCPSGVFLEGSAFGWAVAERRQHMLYSVGVHRGMAYVGAPWPEGLLRRDETGLVTVDREKEAYQMDTRQQLLLAGPYAIFSSPDGVVWTGLSVEAFTKLVENRAPEWTR